MVHAFADVVHGETGVEALAAVEGVVPLGEGRAARVEPAVHHEWLALHRQACWADKGKRVHDRAVQVDVVGAGRVLETGGVGFLDLGLKFGDRADAQHFAGFAAPHRQGRAPVALTGNGPVLDVAKPLAKAAFADPIRRPFDLVVEGEQAVLDRGHADEPAVHGVVEQRMIGAPAVRIVVQVGLLTVQHA